MTRNGNIIKGNQGKKDRRKINPHVAFMEGNSYGKIVKLSGCEHVEVELATKNEDGLKNITCRIPGKMYKKIWFNKDQIVVVGGSISKKVYELRGFPLESEEKQARKLFDKSSDDNNVDVHIGCGESDDESDDDDEILGIDAKKAKTMHTKEKAEKSYDIPQKTVTNNISSDEDNSSEDESL